jgi:uncharacterized membrane protein YfcA
MLAVLVPALFVGLVLGLLGAGGSILTVPILVYLGHMEPHAAVISSLTVVGVTSLVAALPHARAGRVRLRVALLFSLASVPSALLGTRLSRGLSSRVLMLLFAAVMTISALAMLLRRQPPQSEEPEPLKLLGVGFLVGLVTGVVGVGGGFLIVPALVLLAGLSMTDAVGTSLVSIAFACAAGLLGKWGSATVDWSLTGGFLAVALLGSLLGTQMSRRVAAARLRRGFAGFVLLVALVLVLKNA